VLVHGLVSVARVEMIGRSGHCRSSLMRRGIFVGRRMWCRRISRSGRVDIYHTCRAHPFAPSRTNIAQVCKRASMNGTFWHMLHGFFRFGDRAIHRLLSSKIHMDRRFGLFDFFQPWLVKSV
jgi:hypothetical protein